MHRDIISIPGVVAETRAEGEREREKRERIGTIVPVFGAF